MALGHLIWLAVWCYLTALILLPQHFRMLIAVQMLEQQIVVVRAEKL